nr:uncharacterized protein LOC112038472 [Quercus suber]
MMNFPTVQAPVRKKPLLLYLATSSYVIGALIAQEDEISVEQPVYYISRALKDAETGYLRAERACLPIVYASQRLRHYFLAYEVWLMAKSHAIKTLLQQPILSGRLSQWLLQLSQYDLRIGTPRVVKSQAIVDLLAQFPGEEEFLLDDEVPGEVAMAEERREQWIIKFDGSSTTQSGGVGVVLYHKEDKAVALSFKLEFSCSNNTAEYEAYLTGLATALKIGVKHLRVLGDSNLVACQAKGSFSLKEPNLAPYRAMAQRMEEKFSTFEIEHAPRNENRFTDALAALGSQITSKGDSATVKVNKRRESIIETMKERFQEKKDDKDWLFPIKEALMKDEDAVELKVLKDYALVRGELYHRMPRGVLSRLDLVGPINPPSRGYIWILVAIEYFTKWAEAIPLRKATGEAVANFIKENIIIRFGVPHRIISDNGTPFVNSEVRKMLEFYQIKHHRSSPYYPQGNGQAEATNKVLIKISSKMSQEYTEGWAMHLPDALWAYQKSPKSATGFSHFSLVYGIEVVSPTKVMIPPLRVMQIQGKEEEEAFAAERCEDLEGLDEKREKAQECGCRCRQKMAEAYGRITKERVFAEGQLVLKVTYYVRRGMAGPSKFAPKWEGPLMVREAYPNGYY